MNWIPLASRGDRRGRIRLTSLQKVLVIEKTEALCMPICLILKGVIGPFRLFADAIQL